MAPKTPEPFILPGKEKAFAKALGGGSSSNNSAEAPNSDSTKLSFRPTLVNKDDLARLYTHVHPALVLALFYARFNATVRNPVFSLATLLPVTGLLQCVYCILCLPASSTSASSAASTPAKKPSARKPNRKASPSRNSSAQQVENILPAIFSLLLAFSVGTPLLIVLLVLHGAPVTTHIAHTSLAGAHFAVLATLPLFFVHGVNSTRWRAIAGLGMPVDEVFGAGLGACIGAWLGAIPIPLDWDRPWQAWPITIVAGMYGGWAVGKLMGGTLLFGNNISFDD